MFSELRRPKQKLSDDRTVEILEKENYGVLSTCGEDGQPYGVPVNFVYENGKIYFHCAMAGKKLDNIALNDKVSFTVTAKSVILQKELSTSYESVVAMGKASLVEGDEKRHALELVVRKYSPDFVL
jgi:nitroimidazol reductase NimA-like FMN-containing flavoprotein (pyridoxamine 5'-phosphate oxidase superfamily)